MSKANTLQQFHMPASAVRVLAAILFMLVVLGCCASAYAEPVLPDADSSLTIIWQSAAADGESFAGTQFRAYRVADVNIGMEFTPTTKFSSYGLSLNGLSAQEWLELAVLLSGNVQRDSVQADSAGILGTDGALTFPGVTKPGLYLITGDKHEGKDIIYTPQPAMVSIPDLKEDGTWNYNVSSALKYTAAEKQMNLKVTKIWADAGYSSYRPSSVSVRILCDGEKYTDVYLNKSNNWTWTLEDVDPSKTWDVKELSENSSYTTSYKRYDYDILTSFYITNTKVAVPVTALSYIGTTIYGGGVGISARYLPQTGMLWWPVPIFAVCGIVCLLVGLKKRGGRR